MCKCSTADVKCQYLIRNRCNFARDGNYYKNLNISFEICVNVFTTDLKCQYFIANIYKSFMGPHGSLFRIYMDRMWGPSMARNENPA